MNYSNIDKVVITNEAAWGQSPLTLNDDDLTKLKTVLGHYNVIGFTMSIEKALRNLRVDFYKDNKIKYSMGFYSADMANQERTVIALSPQYYTINPRVAKILHEILEDNDFSMEPY
ncbi:hypothetical protein HZI73_07780 [Vallitalea pronyensis]|uniref:Uncharacterized protein n=1 Tax=Vallitalea pronyensis TaxID=1348613 RepID=A0A8J8MIR2_9FIRM|nr:hypothetical protein [Vallitalea pronyensis]QUI22201.1 hypothetical protein HZI73_07780 [Vallitalea pronyensis]